MIDDAQPLKRPVSVGAAMPVSTGLYMNPPTPGIPSGSDTSESSVPVNSSSHVYRPVPRTGGVLPLMAVAQQFHEQKEFPPFNFSEELLGVMQEMIRKLEVRSYMAGLEQQNGMFSGS
ncbi:hypothetical protein SESBI_43706 [Sesbania bispinosa]|nr:hypothetical protein SESBI_43706 [Sesbania bispinosa]